MRTGPIIFLEIGYVNQGPLITDGRNRKEMFIFQIIIIKHMYQFKYPKCLQNFRSNSSAQAKKFEIFEKSFLTKI